MAAFAVLALGTAAIAGLGAGMLPRYGDLTPFRASGVVDVRSAPHPVGWSTDLARSILPGIPVRCVSFTGSDSSTSLVLLIGGSQPLGSANACSSLTMNQVESTVALFDASTGRVLWTKDLRDVFGTGDDAVASATGTIVPSAGRVVVQSTVGDRYSIATLSTATGQSTGRVVRTPALSGQAMQVEGMLMLSSGSTSREGSTSWTLTDVRRVDEPLWTAILPDTTAPLLTKRAAFALIDGRSVRIDGKTGDVTDFGEGGVDLSNPLQDADGLVTTHVLDSGTIVSAYGASGQELWSRSGTGDLSGISRDCVVVSLPGTTKITCLDRSDGRSRWTTDIGSQAYAYWFSGQTTDDVPVYRSSRNRTEVVVFDGSTGRQKYVLRLEPLSYVVAVSRTTGYVRSTSQSGTGTGIAAFDVESGRTLWARTAADDGETEFWGGHLVAVSASQVATELGDRAPMILGDH